MPAAEFPSQENPSVFQSFANHFPRQWLFAMSTFSYWVFLSWPSHSFSTIRYSSFEIRISSNLHPKSFLLLRFFSFLFPLLNACVNAAEGEEFFFVVNHFFAARAGEG